MKKESALYKLCKNLTKKETTYLKKFVYQQDANNQKRIQKVLEEYAKLKSYKAEDEKIIFREIYNAKNIAASRKYVFDKIIASLADYYSESESDLMIIEKLRYFLVLKKKQLSKEALQSITKLSKNVSEGNISKFRYDILAAHYSLLSVNLESNEKEAKRIADEIAKEGRIVYQNGIARDLYNQTIQLRKTIPVYCHTKEQYTAVDSILSHSLLGEEELHSDFAKLVVVRCKCQLLLLKGETQMSIDLLTPYIEEMVAESVADKLRLGTDIFSLLLLLLCVKDKETFNVFWDRLDLLVAEMDTCYQKEVLSVYLLTTRLSKYKINEDKKPEDLDKWAREMKQYKTQSFADQYLGFFGLLAGLHFEEGSSEKAIQIIHEYIYAHEELEDFKIYHFQARILELMALLEMGLLENIKSRVRSFERLLTKEKHISLCFETIVQYFKRYLSEDFSNPQKHFMELREELQEMAKVSKTDQLLIEAMNLDTWLRKALEEWEDKS